MRRFVDGRIAFVILGAMIVLYVALCTRFRDGKLGADAWEHHRSIMALVEDPWHPTNPTYATSDTSIRFSPYMVTQAFVCRAMGWSAYDVLSGAAVLNTVLLVLGVWCLLRALNEEASAAAVLAVMIGLYGVVPGYANSYALADLSWHQVNPSAFAFSLTLFCWTIFLRLISTRFLGIAVLVLSIMTGVSLLDHAMTGMFTMIGYLLFAVTADRQLRPRMIIASVLIGIGSLAVCMAWPWYDFMYAARLNPDYDYWFNPYILTAMLTTWAWPAYLCGLASLSLTRPVIRRLLLGALVCTAIAMAAFVVKSPTLARLPMPAMIFLHIPIGIFCHDQRLFQPATWPGRIRALIKSDDSERYTAILVTMVGLMYFGSFLPQIRSVLITPHLARPYISRLIGKPTKLVRYREIFDELLRDIGPHDVVLSDLNNSWMIPSSRGRIVAALHYEFFVKGQNERTADLVSFFAEGTSTQQRLDILAARHVRWIVLDSTSLTPSVVKQLTVPEAVVRTVGNFMLLDAEVWRKRMRSRTGESTESPTNAKPIPPLTP